jgi:uncharacterized protein YjbI with pentapeptide repeats
MESQDFIDILKQGVTVWNQWRIENPNAHICITDANLQDADLRYVNLEGIESYNNNFCNADLSHANLKNFGGCGKLNFERANLSHANLEEGDIVESNLKGANLENINIRDGSFGGSDLRDANLSKAILNGTALSECDLRGANLTDADLEESSLYHAQLDEATIIASKWRLVWEIQTNGADGRDLSGVDLGHTDLSLVSFKGANLSNAMLRFSNLIRADFSDANLSNAVLYHALVGPSSFRNADLRGAHLVSTKIQSTDFTGAKLTGACFSDCEITGRTKFKDIDCQYIFLKSYQFKNYSDRVPADRDFAPGEFARRFSAKLKQLVLEFREQIDWQAFTEAFKQLKNANPDTQLEIQSISRANPFLKISIDRADDADAAKLEEDFWHNYHAASNKLGEGDWHEPINKLFEI